jgi:Cu2+-exporting ATPase
MKRVSKQVMTSSQSKTANSGYESLVTVNDDGTYSLAVLVDGVHCAACIQKIESALNTEADIQKARLNFSTRRLSMTWAGAKELADYFIDKIEALGYQAHPYDVQAEEDSTKAEERFLLLCLGVAGFAVGNIMLLSIGLWTSDSETMGGMTRQLLHWISALIAMPTILFSGRPFFRSAFGALSKGHTNMDVPISLALILACGMSLFETIYHGEHVYFDSAVMLMFFLLIGRYLDFRARKQARGAASDLLQSLSGFAVTIAKDGTQKLIPVRDLQPGMIVSVAAGEKFPADGIVTKGTSTIDTALITGESLPRDARKGDQIYAGTLNLSAPLQMKIIAASDNTLLADIIKLMEQAEQSQSSYVRLADRAARAYTPVVHSVALAAFLGWWLVGGIAWQDALMIAITVLIITCPCALGLAVPVVQVLASGKLLKHHILVKSGDALERLARIDMMFLDKTGTITRGQPELQTGTYSANDLKLAASLAAHSSHPLSRSLSRHYDGALYKLNDIKEHAGKGISATYRGHKVQLGSAAWCGVKTKDTMPVIWLKRDGKAPQPFTFHDELRSDVKETLALFRKAGVENAMISGDRAEVAIEIATQAGITNIHADQTPPQKFALLEDMQADGKQILMVGDGLNDAPALAAANISIAPGTAIDLAQNAADIVFMGEKFRPVYTAYSTARATQKLVKQNFALALAYNLIAIPVALCGLVTPFVAALAMSGSSLLVILNSFRLKLTR